MTIIVPQPSRHLYKATQLSQLPLVDLSQSPVSIGKAIHEACTKVGFFYCINHGVSAHVCESVLSEARTFFTLNEEEKQKISIQNSDSFRGYQSFGENVTSGSADAHEALDFFSESEDAKCFQPTNYGTNQWPCAQPKLQPVMESYVQEMTNVGKKLLQGCALGLNLKNPAYFEEFFTDPFWIMRLINYPPPSDRSESLINNNNEELLGTGEHTDYGIFTMILSEDVSQTLQIRSSQYNDDSSWMFVDPLPGAFTVNVGDMLSRWTNGIYKSTPHRVLRPTGGRISCPFFFEPNYSAVISPIPELVQRSKRPLSFEPIRYGEYLWKKTNSNFAFNCNNEQ